MAPSQHQQEFDSKEILKDITAAMSFVEDRVINRKEVVEQIFLALLLGEHILIESRTGVGKTLLADQVFLMFENARVFKVQASKEQQPDTYFGGLDIEELKRGRIIHNTEGSLVESEFGFIDEIFDANDYTLRALLAVLNERALIRGVQRRHADIHTVIAATNYLRISEITEALLDRFLFKALIAPDKEPFQQYRISQQYLKNLGEAVEPPKKISYAELKYAHDVIKGLVKGHEIAVAPEIAYFMNLVIRHYEIQQNRMLQERPHEQHTKTKDFYISPRTQAKALDLVRAIAYLHGREHVERSDLKGLHFLLCTSGIAEQKALFAKSYETLEQHYVASGAFEQLQTMLNLEDLLTKYKHDPALMDQPLTELGSIAAKRSIIQWAKETVGLADSSLGYKRRMVDGFLATLHPVTDDLKVLKSHLEKEARALFGHTDVPFE